jgi:hypothetical protein
MPLHPFFSRMPEGSMHVVVYYTCDQEAFSPAESIRLHDVETVLYLPPQYLIAVVADQLKVGKHLLEGEEPAGDRREDTAQRYSS